MPPLLLLSGSRKGVASWLGARGFCSAVEDSQKSHSGTEVTPSTPRAEAQSDGLRGEESTQDEQRSG